ncbi:hypothetical protein QTO17_05505, partial [Vibrio owensii]
VFVGKQGKGKCDGMDEFSGVNCEIAHEMIEFSESPAVKILMMIMVMTVIFSSVVNPNLVMFAGAIVSILTLANMQAIIRAVLLGGA